MALFGRLSEINNTAINHDEGLRQYFLGIYNLMFKGLVISGGVGVGLAFFQPALLASILSNIFLTAGILIGSLVVVMVMGVRMNSMSIGGLRGLFYLFATLIGLNLAIVMNAVGAHTSVLSLAVTACVFGTMSLYGYTTKRCLEGVGSFCFVGLIAGIVAMLVNIFIGSTLLDMAISMAMVVVFVGLTAWDTQKLKTIYLENSDNADGLQRAQVMGATTLFLDFINLFILFARLMGGNRN